MAGDSRRYAKRPKMFAVLFFAVAALSALAVSALAVAGLAKGGEGVHIGVESGRSF